MSTDHSAVSKPHDESARIISRLQLYFALLSCLGGLSLASGSETESIPVIAVFFSFFGYIFVDYLKLFALPPIAAYAAMAVAALYCVSDFADLDAPGNHQMVAVAQLLVFVQAILMMQKKSRRIFEQLGVFCLLELIVAAVFNNAMTYGILLIPIGIIGARALTLLSAVSATEGLNALDDLEPDESIRWPQSAKASSRIVSVRSPNAVDSLTSAAKRLPRVTSITLAPPVILVAIIFFYALPRTTDASRTRGRGAALVGFSDTMNLDQIGQMQQSTARALRIYLKDRRNDITYSARSVYLRGRVLERYRPSLSSKGNSATWEEVPGDLLEVLPQLPNEFIPQRNTDTNFYDPVSVSITCESMRSNSLFAIAPYHRNTRQRNVLHGVDTWTISREEQSNWNYPRTSYSFATNAFRGGVQTELLGRVVYEPPRKTANASDTETAAEKTKRAEAERRAERYETQLLRFNVDAIPSASRLAEQFVMDPNTRERRSNLEIARALSNYLSSSGDFRYTLNLDAESLPGVDPIEQFLAVDRRGHCQYFASALVMMLRSVDIPARVVVGYNTDEFNELGQYFVARQLHAHSWVEALIDAEELDLNSNVYGQAECDQYWLRLDPTPATGRIQESGGGAAQYLDVAQNVWDDYVVDMDASAQQDSLLLGGGMTPMSGSYANMVEWLSTTIAKVRSGELGGGSLATRNLFSWQAAVFGGLAALLIVFAFRIRAPAWILRQLKPSRDDVAARPKIEFYAEALDQLARVGISRQPAQTPDELRQQTHDTFPQSDEVSISQPLARLTAFFYRARFGDGSPTEMQPSVENQTGVGNQTGVDESQSSEADSALADLTQSVERVISQGNRRRGKLE